MKLSATDRLAVALAKIAEWSAVYVLEGGMAYRRDSGDNTAGRAGRKG